MKVSCNTFCFGLIAASTLLLNAVVQAKQPAQRRVLDEEQVEFFRREGYLQVSGLLSDSLTQDLAVAAHHTIRTSPKYPFFYSVSQQGLLFGSTQQQQQQQASNASESMNAYRQAALYSQLPQAAAELMKLDPHSQNLRVLRDVFLAKSVQDQDSCDWHVDDLGFWPESYLSEEQGVNVWIALDDMPAAYQGSMAVAPRSHVAEWRERAYAALGQNRSTDGGKTKEEVIHKIQNDRQAAATAVVDKDKPKSKYPTCDMRLVDPEVRDTIDETKQILDIKRGDVIFATRLLFHRSLPVTDSGLKHYLEQGNEHLSRYSIRYVPGTARLPNGWSVEWSILQDRQNAGRDLDTVVQHADKLFYPQVWPELEPSLQTDLEQMQSELPNLAQAAQAEFMATIFGNLSPIKTSS